MKSVPLERTLMLSFLMNSFSLWAKSVNYYPGFWEGSSLWPSGFASHCCALWVSWDEGGQDPGLPFLSSPHPIQWKEPSTSQTQSPKFSHVSFELEGIWNALCLPFRWAMITLVWDLRGEGTPYSWPYYAQSGVSAKLSRFGIRGGELVVREEMDHGSVLVSFLE